MHLAYLIWIFTLTQLHCSSDFECTIDTKERVECGYLGIARDECIQRGCCWKEAHSQFPWCFSKRSSIECSYYEIERVLIEENAVRAELLLNTTQCPKNISSNDYIKQLVFEAFFDNENQVRIQIKDVDNQCWQIPREIVPICNQKNTSSILPNKSVKTEIANTNLSVQQQEDHFVITHQLFSLVIYTERFNFKLIRNDGDERIFDTSTSDKHTLIFQRLFKTIGTSLPVNANIYGLGENISSFRKNSMNSTFTFFNQDSPTLPNVNLYGSHPFYLEHRGGKSHGVFLRNSNGMDIILAANRLQYKVIGGIFDFFFFAGPSPLEVIQQYTNIIGKPFFIPYWSLGFHQCRYGYKNINEIETVVDEFHRHNIPLETMWMDIDYMNEFENFSFDPKNFPQNQVKNFVDKLHSNGQHFIPIVDPGIKIKSKSIPYEEGISKGIFIKTSLGKPFHGSVWPGLTHFPDFLHPDTEEFWKEQLSAFHELCSYDGLWLDMNEISNFCNGECRTVEAKRNFSEKTCNSKEQLLENSPYNINNSGIIAPLNTKTIDMSCLHHGNILEYNVHNLYGLLEAKTTNKVLKIIKPSKRPFIISRSTFAGSGAYCGHWTGDNFSDWKNLRYSISSILTFQLFGIPMVGADICGFIGDVNEELCARWMQLGSMYPFSRNHNSIQAIHQEPYRFPRVAEVSRKYLLLRYSLLPYFYLLFYNAHVKGNPVWNPLFFEFPTDTNTFAIEEQFMLGSALLLSPCLHKGAIKVNAYFPQSIWYPYEDEGLLVKAEFTGSFVSLNAPLDYMPIHLRGGYIIPTQKAALTTRQVKESPLTLLIGLSEKQAASGMLYDDDGESDSVDNQFTLIEIKATLLNSQLFTLHFNGKMNFSSKVWLKKLIIFTLSSEFNPKMVFIKNESITSNFVRSLSYKISVEFKNKIEIKQNLVILIH